MALTQLRFVPVFATVPFGPGWWSFAFSYLAVVGFATRMAVLTGFAYPAALTAVVLAVATAAVAALLMATAISVVRGTYIPITPPTPHRKGTTMDDSSILHTGLRAGRAGAPPSRTVDLRTCARAGRGPRAAPTPRGVPRPVLGPAAAASGAAGGGLRPGHRAGEAGPAGGELHEQAGLTVEAAPEARMAACTDPTAAEPSPTAAATRFTVPLRTSPTANTEGMLVSYSNGAAVQDLSRRGPAPWAGRPYRSRRTRSRQARRPRAGTTLPGSRR